MVREIAGGVAITEDLVKQRLEYLPTYLEWLFKTSVQINKRANQTSSGTSTIYTIPENHVFYLMSAFLSMFCDGTGAGATGGASLSTNQYSTIMSLDTKNNISNQESQSITFPYGLKFGEGESLIINVNIANTRAMTSIQGYLVKKEVI